MTYQILSSLTPKATNTIKNLFKRFWFKNQ